jgi:hypothetical protein
MTKKPRPKKAASFIAKRKGTKPEHEVLLKHTRSQDTRLEEKPQMPEPTASAPAAAAGERQQAQAQIRYVDRADMGETFADSISGLIFDGQTLRIEFSVTRFDEMKTNTPITGRRYPACRLVLPPAAAVDLINRMQQIAAALTQAGVVKPAAPRAAAAKAD